MSEIVELMNKACARELRVSIQYIWQHVMVKGMTSPEVADLLKETAKDEMKHYEKIAERIDYLGGVPTTQPDTIIKSKTNAKMIKDDIEAELEAISLYKEIIEKAMQAMDYATAELFEEILVKEEEHHHNFMTLLE